MKTKLTALLVCALLCAETQAVAQEQVEIKSQDNEPGLFAQCIMGMIVIAVGIGGYKIYLKCKKKGECIKAAKRKQLDEASGDDASTNNVGHDINQIEQAASFVMGPAPLGDEPEFPVVGLSYITPQPGETNIVFRIFIPDPNNIVDDDTLRARHGLSTNAFIDSFSVNTIATPKAGMITKIGDLICVHVPDATNVITSLQRSIDLINWQTQFTLSSRVGATNTTFDDSSMKAFFRVMVHQ